ncbi:MAG: hypothetical protein Q9195_005437 [Heterodermia aff. obscurata]
MASANPKPTILIVPGAWHPPSAYSELATHLESAGFPTLTLQLPSLNSPTATAATCGADTDSVREKLIALIEPDGKDVLVIAHSYGGIPAGGASRGLSKTTRSQAGARGGVIGLLYMCAHVVPGGTTVMGYLGIEYPPWVQINQPSEGLCTASTPVETFYQDLDPAVAKRLAECLEPQALMVFTSPTPAPAWAEPEYQGKLAYIRTTLDQTSPVVLQDIFWQRSGVEWIVRNFESGHSPFANKISEVVGFTVELVEKFGG